MFLTVLFFLINDESGKTGAIRIVKDDMTPL